MSASPPFSIVITTRDPQRLPYLSEAVRSCAAQGLSPSEFEIVIASAYPLETSSLPASTAPVRIVRSTGAWQGGRMRDGVRAARGAFLVLMDDDDVFEPGKLAHLSEVVRREPNLDYYHHECSWMDAHGTALDRTDFHRGHERFKGPGYYGTYDPARKDEAAERMVQAFAFFNPSSTVISRRLAETADGLLGQVPTAPDLALFFLAFGTPGKIQLDSSVLTRYRIHGGNDSILTWPDIPLDFRVKVVETLTLIDRLSGTSMPPRARQVLRSMRLSGSFGVAVMSGRSNQGEVSRAMWRLLRSPLNDWFTRFSSVPVAIAYMIHPSLAQWFLRKFRVRDLLAS